MTFPPDLFGEGPLVLGRDCALYGSASRGPRGAGALYRIAEPGLVATDADGDAVPDGLDDCRDLANADQTDADADLVGDACDSCTNVANPRLSADALAALPGAKLSGGQRDDDSDGFGNACDGKFTGGTVVGSADLTELRASLGQAREGSNCGMSHSARCASFDLDGKDAAIGPGDLARLGALLGKPPGPKCPTCPLATP